MAPTDAYGNIRTGVRRRHRGRRPPLHATVIVVLAALLLLAPPGVAGSPPGSAADAPLVVPAPKVLDIFPVGTDLADAVVSPDGKRLYVTDGRAFDFMTHTYSGGVHVVDTASKKVTALINVGNGPIDIVLNRAGTLAYVVNGMSNTVSVIDTRTNTVIRTLAIPTMATQIVLNAAETIGYVITVSSIEGLVLLDLQTGRIIARIPAGWNPHTVAVNASETTAYTANLSDGTLTVIDLKTRTVASVIPVGRFAYGVTVNPAGTRAYINGFDSIVVVNLSTEKIAAEIPLTAIVAGRVHLNRAGTLGFSIAGHDGKAPAGGILHVIDLSSNEIVGTAPVGLMGNSIAFDPSGQRAYVPSGAAEGTVTLLQMPQ